MNISKLFTRYGSDKACGVLGDPSSGHWFGEKYDEIFNSLDPKIAYNILEIGIQKAGCMKAIREILPNSILWGIDIENQILPEYRLDSNVTYIFQDATDINVLKHFENLKFDIIIDDGSHKIEDVCFVVNNYLNLLSEKGLMIIEDCQIPSEWLKIISKFIADKPFELEFCDYRNINNRYDDFLILIRRKK